MDPRILRYYNRELQFLREMGGEFARQFPKVAGRLGMDGFEVADPYVERLMEGAAFMAARVQLKIDDEFPRFTQHLLEIVYPQYLSPTPSMAVVQLRPSLREGSLLDGFTVRRGTVLRSRIAPDEQTACEFRIARDTTLWPLEVVRADYRTFLADLGPLRLGSLKPAAALRLRLRVAAGLTLDQLALSDLPLFFRADAEFATRLHAQLAGRVAAVIARPVQDPVAWQVTLDDRPVRPLGFDDAEALLPVVPRTFQGYRYLHEYFAMPQRYLFVEVAGLSPAIRRCAEREIDLIFLFDTADAALDGAVDASHVALYCTPAINLFPRRADRVHLTDGQHEYHVVPDRTRPTDLEVYDVSQVVGHGVDVQQRFLPLYGGGARDQDAGAFYTLHRERRRLSDRQRSRGPRTSSYIGSETFIALVDGMEGPFRSDLRQLALETLCTNRDLPLHMPIAQGDTDFSMESGAPVESVRCVAGPTSPVPSHAEGSTAWRLISHLSLNYLSLTNGPEQQGAAALREILALYAPLGASTLEREIRGVQAVSSRPIVRMLPSTGAFAFGRGVEVTLTLDETGFAGAGGFLLGSVLERFFARYAAINSFTETVLRTAQRGEIMRWPTRIGQTPGL